MIRLLYPEWLIVAAPIVLLIYRVSAFRRPLRVLLLSAIVIILSEPELKVKSGALDLWVLIDRSASAAQSLSGQLREWEMLLEQGRGKDDSIHYVDFAQAPQIRSAGGGAVYSGDTEASKLPSAVRYVLAQLSPSVSSRILVFTDGYSTEPFKDLASQLLRQKVALDYRLLSERGGNDYWIENLNLPSRVEHSEPFVLELEVRGEPDADIDYRVLRESKIIFQDKMKLQQGRGFARFSDSLPQARAYRYDVEILPQQDEHAGNNRASAWIEAAGEPKLLLISGYTLDPLAQELSGQKVEVETINDFSQLNAGSLAGARCVIINNVGANMLPEDFLRALDFFVRVQGGGLIMIGGKTSFGSGGYSGSVLDPLLPVSMELRTEHRLSSVAMAIVLDRSGSMGMGVPGANVTKIELANEGVVQAIHLLSPKDQIAVLAVDSEAHVVVPLVTVGENGIKIEQAARGINSEGGGIYIFNGLDMAWKTLKDSELGNRHIILFADAADSEEPGAYRSLLADIRREKATVSVIGMGTAKDTDAGLLTDIAALGGGRLFFSQDPAQFPLLFAQETAAVARSMFADKPAKVSATGGWKEVSAGELNWPSELDAYNVNYLKEGASCAALAEDEYHSPLVAFWQRGAGRTAAVSFPLGGENSSRARNWKEYGQFAQSLLRWTMGGKLIPGIGLRLSPAGSSMIVDLMYDNSWQEQIALNPPRIFYTLGLDAEVKEQAWERLRPGIYQASLPLAADEVLRGAVQAGSHILPFGPLTAVRSPEWNFSRERLLELAQASSASGGQERLDIPGVWKAPRPEGYLPLTEYLLWVLLFLLLLEALLCKLSLKKLPALSLPELMMPKVWPRLHFSFSWPRWKRQTTTKKQASGVQQSLEKPTHSDLANTQAPGLESGAEAAKSRRERFWKAKNRL